MPRHHNHPPALDHNMMDSLPPRPSDPSLSRHHLDPNMIVTPEEYDSLPPSIQKKYFSSVERLRIAQQSASQKRKKQHNARQWLKPKRSMDVLRPQTASSMRSSSSLALPKNPSSATVSEEQARYFLALPDKVKRSQFTQEELEVLTASSERTLGFSMTADDRASMRTPMRRRLPQSTFDPLLSDDSDEDDMDDDEDWPEDRDPKLSLPSRSRCNSELPSLCSSARSQSICSLAKPPPVCHSVRKTHAGRRNFSGRGPRALSPMPLPPPTLLPAPPSYRRSTESTRSSIVSSSPSEGTSETRYYKDSQTRSRLREFLASPEGFDEALEFGFPAQPPSEQSHPETASLDMSIPILETPEESFPEADAVSTASSRSPRTPDDCAPLYASVPPPLSSADSGVVITMTTAKVGMRSLSPDLDGREMTLRMTLTRPDLRVPEEDLHSFNRTQPNPSEQEKSDPLALDHLPVCDDHSGSRGAFAVHSVKAPKAGIKQVWKNLIQHA